MTEKLLASANDAREFIHFLARPFSQEEAELMHKDRLEYLSLKARVLALQKENDYLQCVVEDQHEGLQDLIAEVVQLRAEVTRLRHK